MSGERINIALFASGQGSNAISLLNRAKELKRTKIVALVVDQPMSPLVEKIPSEYPDCKLLLIPAPNEKDILKRRNVHESEILKQIKPLGVQWCFLAGYMRVLGPTFLREFKVPSGRSRVVNIHPSLLPLYPGLHAYEKCFEAGDAFGGCTVHEVTEELDAGPVISQKKFERKKTDTLESFIERGKSLEWKTYGDVLFQLDQNGDLSLQERS